MQMALPISSRYSWRHVEVEVFLKRKMEIINISNFIYIYIIKAQEQLRVSEDRGEKHFPRVPGGLTCHFVS